MLPGAERLQTLALSCNALGPAGLERLLGSLSCRSLGRLELGSVAGPGPQPLTGALGRYLAQVRAVPGGEGRNPAPRRVPAGVVPIPALPFPQEGCALSHLTLSGNRLGDGDVLEVAR